MRPKLLSAASLVIATVFVFALPGRAEDDLALARKVAEANNAFGVALYREFAKETAGNLVFSPFSLSSALALTATGARGQTEKELWQALQLDLPRELAAAGYEEIGHDLDDAAATGGIALTVANGLWVQQGYALDPAFLALSREGFAAEIATLDYALPVAAAGRINEWIAAKTRLLIPRLVEPGSLSPQARLTIANAVYFKAPWDHRFKVGNTRPAPFTLMDGTRVDVPTMQQTIDCAIAETADVRVLCLPYRGQRFEMVVVLPSRNDGLAETERTLDRERVAGWLGAVASARMRSVALELPKFRFAATPGCVNALRRLGVEAAFLPATADFSGMSKERGFAVGAVLHRAVIDVNEEGTKAAAATAVVMYGMAMPPKDPVPFKVDHPFLFFIREVRTGAILFLGRIVDPRAG